MKPSIFSLLVLAGSIFPAQAAVHYVRAAAQGANDGSKWLHAYTKIQDALAAASPGDEIWVAKGTYYPSDDGDRTASFVLQNGVEIYGGFSGLEESRAERQPHFIDCILSGDIDRDATSANNSYQVVRSAAPSAVLDGFVITGGQADGGGDLDNGAGLWVSGGSPVITNSRFTGNHSAGKGGAVHLIASSAQLTNCLMAGNSAGSSGGGFSTIGASNPSLVNCVIRGNSAGLSGGAHFDGGISFLINCTFSGNKGNTAGAVLLDSSAKATFTNCLVWLNYGGSIATPAASIVANPGSIDNYNRSLFQNVNLTGFGSSYNGLDPGMDPDFETAVDPLAAPITAGDLRLSANSPVAELGLNAANLQPHDIAGRLRVMDTNHDGTALIDLGAHELPRIWYVNDTSPAFEIMTTGLSWTFAFHQLKDALALATAGDEIRVAEGVYYPDEIKSLGAPGFVANTDSRTDTFQLILGVTISGGYSDSGSDCDPTSYFSILSGDIDQNDTNADGNFIAETIIDIAGANSYSVITGTGMDPTAQMKGMVVTGGSANQDFGGAGIQPSRDGGAVFINGGNPAFSNCHFIGNTALKNGAAIACYGATSGFLLSDCRVTANSPVLGLGGAVYGRLSNSMVIIGGTWAGNGTATSIGGALDISLSATAAVLDCSFVENIGSSGSALIGSSCKLLLVDGCSFTGNIGSGALRIADNTSSTAAEISNSSFNGNLGGARASIDSAGVSLRIKGCTFTDNIATECGGIFLWLGGSPVITDCTFTSNSGSLGSAIFSMVSGTLTIEGCTFIGNTSSNRGGAVFFSGSTTVLSDCVFESNSSTNYGGALNSESSVFSMTNCAFRGNSSDLGGAVRCTFTSPTVTNCVFTGNKANINGGAWYVSGGSSAPEFINCSFSGNSATIQGGGLYTISTTESAKVHNSIFWNNLAAGSITSAAASVYSTPSATPPIYEYSLVGNIDLTGAGTGNFDGTDPANNPIFLTPVNPATAPTTVGNLRLASVSPLLEMGDNGLNPTTIDLAGNVRITGNIELGAYEGGFGLIDTDGDGMPDTWEYDHTSPASHIDLDPASDADGDAVAALMEFALGLDPNLGNGSVEYMSMQFLPYEGLDYLTLSFRKNPDAIPFVDFRVTRSKDLGIDDPWDETEAVFYSELDGWETHRSIFPRAGQLREFLRLEVE